MVSFITILALAASALAAPISVRQVLDASTATTDSASDAFALGPLGYGSNFNIQVAGAFANAVDVNTPTVQLTTSSQDAALAVTINGNAQLVAGEYVAVVQTNFTGSSVTESTVSWQMLEDVAPPYTALTCSIADSVVSCSAGNMNVFSTASDGSLILSDSASIPSANSAATLNMVNIQ